MTTSSLGAVARYLRHLTERETRALTDHELLDRFTHDQDEAAFTELVRRHGPMVFGLCRRVLRNAHDAEDAFQAVFLVLVRKAGSIRRQEALGGWLYRVTYRVALRARSLGDRRRERQTPVDDVPAPAEDSAGLLAEEVQRLPEMYRAAVVLCYLEGRTQSEAARLLETTTRAVNSRLKRARELLRQRLARQGLAYSGAAVTAALSAGAARAALPAELVAATARTALQFATKSATACGASPLAVALAQGVLQNIMTPKLKLFSALALLVALLGLGALLVPSPVLGEPAPAVVHAPPAQTGKDPGLRGGKKKPQRSVILLWMSGGPSQLDTFDPKPGTLNGGEFKAIKTAVKGVEISEHLPRLAKLTNHMAIIRSVKSREADHTRGTYLMRMGRSIDEPLNYPALPCVLGKELGEGRPELPRCIRLGALHPALEGRGFGPGFLGAEFVPLVVGRNNGFGAPQGDPDRLLQLPPVEAFEAVAKGRGEKTRKAVAKAFDLTEEKAAVRDAYGRNLFGQACLLARRLVERGVPVVEVTMPGWDTHQDNFNLVRQRSAELDAGWASLMKDLHERKKLDSTLIVWMGEFGRTPRINQNNGRDHWPFGFTVVLAGCGIKGGTVIGKTSADGTKVEEREVKPIELHATIYAALGINATKTNRTSTGVMVPLADRGARPIKEALR